ncbi:DNA methyltransferase [Mesorhizobium sp. B1-1-5]|uniref:DNA methyltransferase n=1 Tax=Mesorhizobium sp. B1-1-5 TaxID=2589979 RepID=UPI00112EE457|nr:DNA methyltransferase [Mesorhizobium sp. B1-1-5]TPO13759.1 site-specific DNA-methyltransferase [Mesorhizobium sp. B1-1-5]
MLNTSSACDVETRATFRRFGEIDWDFPAQASESAFSAVHWHPCRFPSQIPALSIGRMSAPGDLVLDPFMGSATTLVEAQRLGRRAIGIDLNPVSCLLGSAKTLPNSAADIRATINGILVQLRGYWEEFAEAELPPAVQGDKWYMPSTLSTLRRLRTLVKRQTSESGSLIARACFSSILLPACREDRHWGYVCDNTRPKGHRAPDARALFSTALGRMADAYSERALPNGPVPTATIINDDAASALVALPDAQVDCVVTSPPYFGVADYVKAQRLTMEWEEQEIEPLRRQEIGARSKRHRITAYEEYLNELDIVFKEVRRVMKDDATAVIVFGQSPKRPDAQTRFTENLIAAGFKLHLERHRQIPSGRRQMPSLVRETVLVFRK